MKNKKLYIVITDFKTAGKNYNIVEKCDLVRWIYDPRLEKTLEVNLETLKEVELELLVKEK